MDDRQDRPIPREIELKLEVDPRDLDRLRHHPLLQQELQGRAPRDLQATYFDTDELALHKAGVSLRVRRDGRRRVQTIKAERSPNQMLLDRTEWERVVRSEKPDLSSLSGTALEDFGRNGVLDSLRPLFRVRQRRTLIPQCFGGSAIEVVLDEGEVEGNGRTAPFAELELELKTGAPSNLFRLALMLAEAVPLRLSSTAKSDRGYALVTGARPQPTKAADVDLKRGMTSASAFQAIGRACLHHLMANEAVLRRERAPEAVHQMRVALRRLRAAVTLFRGMLADEDRDAVRQELRWMADALGEARDLDVLIARIREPGRFGDADETQLRELLAEIEARRDRAYEHAEAAITSPRFGRGVLATAAWIESGPWLALAGRKARRARERPVEDHAAWELTRRRKKIRKLGRDMAGLDVEARHRARIEIKKLRYGVEFFHGLFEGRRVERRASKALKLLEALQERLGELNDMAVAQAMPQPGAAGALGREEAERSASLLAEAQDAYERFARLKPFWT